MRKIEDANGREYTVHHWYILTNGWEYYQTEPTDGSIAFGYVMGDCGEWGSFSLDEMRGHIMASATGYQLYEVAAPSGWKWEEEENDVEVEFFWKKDEVKA